MMHRIVLIGWAIAQCILASNAFTVLPSQPKQQSCKLFSVAEQLTLNDATELPDSLEDAANLAALACKEFSASAAAGGRLPRCRVDFDTSAGDETYSILKTSTEFMQKFVTSLTYAMLPALQQKRQEEMMRMIQAKAELKQLLRQKQEQQQPDSQPGDNGSSENEGIVAAAQDREVYLRDLISRGGRDANPEPYKGPKVRIYFPDEGNAALARRDWISPNNPEASLVPTVVEFSSCGGVQMLDVSQDMVVLFFCPRASESGDVERLLLITETESTALQLVVFVNPNLVDMGVTGFGLSGRLLRERLIDALTNVYYLRTLPWGAITRLWPRSFSVWQQDVNASGGYRLLKSLDQLPSNPQVEDIYDEANGLKAAKQEGGFAAVLDQFGDFVNGMMKL